jgi:Flp pilus assembly pilin Flp
MYRWLKTAIRARRRAQNVVEYGLVVAAIAIAAIGGFNALKGAEGAYFTGLGATLQPTPIPCGASCTQINKLVFTVQPSSSFAGASITPSIQVTVVDGAGSTVTSSSAAITLAIGTNPGGGVLSGTTTVNAASGVATFSGLSIDKPGVGYTLVASGPGLIGATSTAFTISIGPPAKVGFTAQPSTVTSCTSMTPAVQVAIQDAAGNTVTGSTASVSLSIAAGTGTAGATLSGGGPVAASSGIASFTNVFIDKTGTGYQLTASSAGLTSATSTAFNITVGSANQLAFIAQPSDTTAGVSINSIQVAVEDSCGNVVTSSTVSITMGFGNNPASGTLSGTKTQNAISGVATFSNLSINKSGTGYTLTASSTGLSTATSTGFNITAAAPSSLVFTTGPSNVAAGAAINPAMRVTVLDAFGNVVTSSSASVTMSIGANPGGAALSGTSTVNAAGGVATFSNLSLNKVGTGYTLVAASPGLPNVTSGTFNVTAGAVSAGSSAVIANPTTVSSDGSSTSTITVTLFDTFGNPVSGKSVSLSAGSGSSTISAGGTTNASGQVTFTVKDDTAQAVTYTAKDTTDNITLTQTATVTFSGTVVSADKSTVTSNCASPCKAGSSTATITVTLKNAAGNPVSGVSVSISQTGSSVINPSSATTNASGVATFTVTDATKETPIYTAIDTTDGIRITQTTSVNFS